MKRLAAVLLLVVALAAASTAFAQTQRWEYAVFTIMTRPGGLFDDSHPAGASLHLPDEEIVVVTRNFLYMFRSRFGQPANPDGWWVAEVLNTLGRHGWELVSVTGGDTFPIGQNEYSDHLFYFRRPAP